MQCVNGTGVLLQSGGEDSLQVTFLPFTMGLHYCCLIFEDGDCGSFMYELIGEGRLPAPARPLTFQVFELHLDFIPKIRINYCIFCLGP